MINEELRAIDTAYNFRLDCAEKGDPDKSSHTLRTYHRLLWSKPLPDGRMFDLVEKGTRGSYYLKHESDLGMFRLSSDTITTRLFKQAKSARLEIPFDRLPPYRGYTIASALLFPMNQRQRKQTINQVRGTLVLISDRFDLTLECIRRHYAGEHSVMSEALERYSDFFDLFGTFDRYVDFWLLQDLVRDGQVRFWTPFDNFARRAVPPTVETYLDYYRAREDFITARNTRIAAYVAAR